MYECIIVGGGPAGITAGVYLARKKVDFLMVSLDIGGQTLWSGDIENYTGYQYITGTELAEKFNSHLKQFNIEIKEEEAESIEKNADSFSVKAKETYTSKTVIVATGRNPKKINVPGEDEFYGKGVTYCAICDGPLFAKKDVVVVGGGNAGMEVALQMARIAGKVYIVEKQKNLTGDGILIDKVNDEGSIQIFTGTGISEIRGSKFVEGVSLQKGGSVVELDAGGVLIEAGSIPNSSLMPAVEKNRWGEIIVNCSTNTSIPGLFAAGDVTNVYKKQIIIACGEGAKSAIAASEYLYRMK